MTFISVVVLEFVGVVCVVALIAKMLPHVFTKICNRLF